MKKTLTAILTVLAMIAMLLPQTCLANDSAFDLAAAKKAYENKVASLKKSDKDFCDAYVIDMFNDGEPVLITTEQIMGQYQSKTYKYVNGKLKELEYPYLTDASFFSVGYYSNGGGTGGRNSSYFAVDDNGKIYVVSDGYFRNLMHNEFSEAKSNSESDVVFDFEIGYYKGSEYTPIYHNSRYRYNDGDYSYTLYSHVYRDGNEEELDLGNDDETVLASFGLKVLIEHDEDWPNYKGEYLYKYLNLVTVYLNDELMTFEKSPVIKDGRVLVPLRAIFEAMGATVAWDGNAQKAASSKNGTTVEITIGSNVLYKNGAAVALDVPAQLIDGYTMVPVRAVAEAFGADVAWYGDEKAEYINYADDSEVTDDYEAKVNAFLSDPRFKNGADWGSSKQPNLISYDASGCCAYVIDFCKFVFDKNSYSEGTPFSQPSEIRAGDVIHVTNTSHWFVVISRDGNSLTVAEGNWDGKVVVSDDIYTVEDNILKRNGAPFRTFSEAFHMQ